MVYLLHLNQPLGHARHYIGWAKDQRTLEARLDHHKTGHGARFTQVCLQRDITWTVAKVFENGDKTFERKLKNRNGASRFCPICILQGKRS